MAATTGPKVSLTHHQKWPRAIIRAKWPVNQWLIKALRFATRLDQRPGLRPVVIEALRASITTGWSCVLA